MKKTKIFAPLVIAFLCSSAVALGADHSGMTMDHSNMPGMDHSKMKMPRDHSIPADENNMRRGPSRAVPVVTPDVPHLPWKMVNGAKEFHLTAEIVKREVLPGSTMGPAKVLTLWGYNGSVPGPTIEVNEGDRVRVVFHNKLPEPTTVHWHGLEVPVNMDGVPFISQPPIKPEETFVYEFTLNQNGTFFYHSHGAMQEMMGAIGLFIIHPKKPHHPVVQKDFGIVLQEFAALQNNPVPNSMGMEFNWLTFNGKAGPATTPLIVRQGDRVRIRLVNLGMDHHPIHIHGNQFYVTGTEGGRAPQSSWFPGNTVLVGVAQSRDIEFDAKYVGDWMLHCHLPHHMMNNMVSMVGPMSHVGHGMHTGGGMEEGMGIVRQNSATDEDLGPTFGRGMGNTVDREQATSHSVGRTDKAGERTTDTALGSDKNSEKGPGYPQDDLMMMPMDAAVAKPENNYLIPGWSGALAGMMNLVRVLPPEKYDQIVRDIKAKHIDAAQLKPGMPGMDHSNMKMPGMDHGGMDHGQMPMDHGGMDHGQMQMPMDKKMPGMDHGQMQHGTQRMQHGSVRKEVPMDHSQVDHRKLPGVNHGEMKHSPTAKPATQRAALEAQMEASRKQMEASRKALESVGDSDQPGKKLQSDKQEGNSPSVDHSKMGH